MDKITTYATLQTAAAGMIHRSSDTNITDNLPLFIQLAEGELYDRMILKDWETETNLTLTTDVNYVALPSGFISPIALWLIVSSERQLLTQARPEELPYDDSSNQPQFWAIDGVNIRFDCPSSSGFTAPFRYVKSNALSASNTSNYILTRRPDLYLWATLKQVALYTKDDADLSKYSGLMEQSILSLKAADSRNRSSVPLRTDLPGTYARSDIYRGE